MIKVHFVIDKTVTEEEFGLLIQQLPFRHAAEFSATKVNADGTTVGPVTAIDLTPIQRPAPVIVKNTPASKVVTKRRKYRKWPEIVREAFASAESVYSRFENALHLLWSSYLWEEENLSSWEVNDFQDVSKALSVSVADAKMLLKFVLQRMNRAACWTPSCVKLPKTIETALAEQEARDKRVEEANTTQTGDPHLGNGTEVHPAVGHKPLDMGLLEKIDQLMNWDEIGKYVETSYIEFLEKLCQDPTMGNIIKCSKYFASVKHTPVKTYRQDFYGGRRVNIIKMPPIPSMD